MLCSAAFAVPAAPRRVALRRRPCGVRSAISAPPGVTAAEAEEGASRQLLDSAASWRENRAAADALPASPHAQSGARVIAPARPVRRSLRLAARRAALSTQGSGAAWPRRSDARPLRRRSRAAVARLADGGVATPREAAALLTRGGWTPLDVRTVDEHSSAISGAVNVPLISASWRSDAATKRRAPETQSRNAAFLRDVAARFPDASTPLLVYCSDGRARSPGALRALEAAGYTRLAGIQGGFAAFARQFDARMAPRRSDDGLRDPDNLFPTKDPVSWVAAEFSAAEVAEAAALLAAAKPAHAQQPVAAAPAAEHAAHAAHVTPSVTGPHGRGEARGEYVIFRF